MTDQELGDSIKKLDVVGGTWHSDEGKEIAVFFWRDNGLPYPAKGDKSVESSMAEISSDDGRAAVFERIKEEFDGSA